MFKTLEHAYTKSSRSVLSNVFLKTADDKITAHMLAQQQAEQQQIEQQRQKAIGAHRQMMRRKRGLVLGAGCC
jgi:hypothetical protein